MTDNTDDKKVSRRSFLRGAGVGAGAAGIAAATLATGSTARSAPADPRQRRSAGYRETEHVRRVYALSRF